MDEPEFVNPDEFDDWDDVDSTTVEIDDDTYEPPTTDGEGCD